MIKITLGSDELPKTIVDKAPRGPIKHLEWVPEKNLLFVVSLKECAVLRFGVLTLLFSGKFFL